MKARRETEYPFSLDRPTETTFLRELESVGAVMLWRADEVQAIAKEYRDHGAVAPISGPLGWFAKSVPGEVRLFGAIEAFLAAWARASLIVFPEKSGGRRAQDRGRHLRQVLKIDEDSVRLTIKDRGLRNGWMHLDEDLDEWSAQRGGVVSPGELTDEVEKAAHRAVAGAIRVVSLDPPSVLLPLRMITTLDIYFHAAQDLHQKVVWVLRQDRWIAHRGVEGLAAGWGGEPQHWEIRTLGGGPRVTGRGETYVAAVANFRTEVDRSMSVDPSDAGR